jgi:hypothetical protein
MPSPALPSSSPNSSSPGSSRPCPSPSNMVMASSLAGQVTTGSRRVAGCCQTHVSSSRSQQEAAAGVNSSGRTPAGHSKLSKGV